MKYTSFGFLYTLCIVSSQPKITRSASQLVGILAARFVKLSKCYISVE